MFRLRHAPGSPQPTAETLRFKVSWNVRPADGGAFSPMESLCASREEADALAASLAAARLPQGSASPLSAALPDPNERFMIGYNQHTVDGVLVEDSLAAGPWNAVFGPASLAAGIYPLAGGDAPGPDQILRHNQWVRMSFPIAGADFGRGGAGGPGELHLKYGNGAAAYVRAMRVTDAAGHTVRWGRFSDETPEGDKTDADTDATFHLRPGFPWVELVDWQDAAACRLPGNWSKAHIETDPDVCPIPIGTDTLTVETEVWIDAPAGVTDAPPAPGAPAASDITVTALPDDGDAWMDGKPFADMDAAGAAAAAGEAAWSPALSPEERLSPLEQQVTDLQLALCEIYER